MLERQDMITGILTEQEELALDICGNRTFSHVMNFLKSGDPRVVLTAVKALYHLRDTRSPDTLQSVLRHHDPEVVHAAVIAMGHLGDDRVVPDVIQFLHADPLLQMAGVYALGELRSPLAIRPLSQLLTDRMTGSLAAEAIARIGGTEAFKVLGKHWLKFRDRLDTENFIRLLKYTIEGIATKKPKISAFRESLSPYLDDPSEAIRSSAARCLLAIGPGREDKKALSILAATVSDAEIFPACLKSRGDLATFLLNSQGIQKGWGFQLVSLFPKAVPVNMLSAAINSCDETCGYIESIVRAVSKIKASEIAPAVLDLYLRVSTDSRSLLNPLLRMYKKQIRSLLIDYDIDDETRLVISSYLGTSPICIALEILDLPLESRISVISSITGCKPILKCLPWCQWLEKESGFYIVVAAEVAAKANLRELLPFLRKTLIDYPIAQVISAVAELGDLESVPILISYLDTASSSSRSLILESLGRIGGKDAREGLKRAAMTFNDKEARIAYRALSGCAEEEDSAFFLEAATHLDWYVRLLCVDVLCRFPSPENLTTVVRLSTDPVPIVAQRAVSFFKYLPMGNFIDRRRGESCEKTEIGGNNEYFPDSLFQESIQPEQEKCS